MLKIRVKLLSKAILLNLRDMEVGMIYKGYKGLPKLVVHKTARSIIIRNIGEEATHTTSLTRLRRRGNVKPTMKVFAIAKNDTKDIANLVGKASSV